MSYDGTPDVVFNPQGDDLPAASEFFTDLDLEPRYYNLPHGDPRFEQGFGREVNIPLEADRKFTVHILHFTS